MALLTEWWVTDIATLFVTTLTLVYLFFKISVYRFWEKQGVPFVKPTFPFGNFRDVFLFRRQVAMIYTELYNELDGKKFGGFYQIHKPTLLLRDLDVIKSILVRDFTSFQDRGVYHDEENDPISNHLFLMGGPKWKALRTKLTPTFTSGKMKMMFEIASKCGEDLSGCVKEILSAGEMVEMQDIFARYTTDVIASCAFGIECNCLKNPDAEFRNKGRDFFKRDIVGQIGLIMMSFAPSLAKLTKWGNTPTSVASFFINAVKETVEFREKNNVTRNDFMQLLIQLKNRGSVDEINFLEGNNEPDPSKRIDMDDVAAQAFIFFLAGFETSSATMAFCLYELALHPLVQSQLRQEIDHVLAKNAGILTYDSMQEMEYLDRVIAETLRKYPPLAGLTRICNTAYTLPGSDVVLQPGTTVIVPVYAIHHDPRYYPDPDVFDPERFTKEEKAKRLSYTYMPFGEGPRNCLGMRFGKMQVKIGLIKLLKNFEFNVSSKTIIPIVIDPKLCLMGSKDGITLQVLQRAK